MIEYDFKSNPRRERNERENFPQTSSKRPAKAQLLASICDDSRASSHKHSTVEKFPG